VPVASGSIAYLGAARFQGFWNATSNAATGSGLAEAASGPFTTLLSGTSPSTGYSSSSNITASAGDYWQVTGAGTFSVDGYSSWALSDWCIYSASADGPGTWKKLAFEDTIASIILGDLSSSSFHIGSGNDTHVIFATGSVHSGSDNFVYDYTNNRVGIGTASPDGGLHILKAAAGSVTVTGEQANGIIVEDDDSTAITLLDPAGGVIYFGDADDTDIGRIGYRHGGDYANSLYFTTNNTQKMTIDSAGNVGIGVADPDSQLEVFGTSTHLKLSNNASDYATLAVGTNGDLTITTVDDAAAAADLTFTIDGDINLNPTTAGEIALTAGAIRTTHDFATTAPLSMGQFDTDGEWSGTVIKLSPGADDTLTVGQLYFLHTDGTWNQTDADAVATGASQMLGIGLGNARSVGVLIKGFIRIPSTEILNVPGSNASPGLPIYVSTTAGHLDFTAPSGTGDFVRVVGYAIQDSTDVLIYFDPDSTWVEIA